MDNSNISRRETFRLARFGVLLAAGLGVAENSAAADPQKGRFDSVMIKGEVGGLVVKFYQVEPEGFALLKTSMIKSVTVKAAIGASYTIKFWKGTNTLGTLSDVMQKV